MDFITELHGRTELPVRRLLAWAEVGAGKFYRWRERYGKVNEHNARVPRDHWLLAEEEAAILAFHAQNPLEGYRRLTFMMNDAGVVAVSPSSVYRVLRRAGVLDRYNQKPSKKGRGFVQPLKAHAHWHIDIAYLNIAGTFYYLCSILDGYSRYLVHWEIRESMTEWDVETIVERAREAFPDVSPRIISDNGPQFIANDFRHYIRLCGMTHVRTSAYYPQSNGKLERWHRTLKATTIRPQCPATVEQARALVGEFVEHYNQSRLHSAIGFVTPADKLAGNEKNIWALRDANLEAARERRKALRAAQNAGSPASSPPARPRFDERLAT